MGNRIRDIFQNDPSVVEKYKDLRLKLLKKRENITLEKDDEYLYRSEPFGGFIGDCESCDYYVGLDGITDGGFCFCPKYSKPLDCGYGFTCPYNTSKENDQWETFQKIKRECIKGMIFATGDIHGDIDIHKLSRRSFNYSGLSKEDYIIICGDFGCVWDGSKTDEYWLNWLNDLPVTILFCDGNHENFDLLNSYPVEEWNGGKIHRIKNSVIHLMRGQVFDLHGCKIFVMGGASSYDKKYRKEGKSWWKQELPNCQELEEAMQNLEKCQFKVDYVLTHCAPSTIHKNLVQSDDTDSLTSFLELVSGRVTFKKWYFGHYHMDCEIQRYRAIYNDFVRIM